MHHYELTFQPIVYEIATLASIIVMFTKGAFHLSELAGPDHYRTSYFDNEIGFFQGFLLKNHLLPAHYYYCQLLVRMLTKMAAFSHLFVCFL